MRSRAATPKNPCGARQSATIVFPESSRTIGLESPQFSSIDRCFATILFSKQLPSRNCCEVDGLQTSTREQLRIKSCVWSVQSRSLSFFLLSSQSQECCDDPVSERMSFLDEPLSQKRDSVFSRKRGLPEHRCERSQLWTFKVTQYIRFVWKTLFNCFTHNLYQKPREAIHARS